MKTKWHGTLCSSEGTPKIQKFYFNGKVFDNSQEETILGVSMDNQLTY